MKKPVSIKGSADGVREQALVIKNYDNTTHHSIKVTPIQVSKKVNETKVYSNLQEERQKGEPKNELADLVRSAEIKRVFSKRDITAIYYVQ